MITDTFDIRQAIQRSFIGAFNSYAGNSSPAIQLLVPESGDERVCFINFGEMVEGKFKERARFVSKRSTWDEKDWFLSKQAGSYDSKREYLTLLIGDDILYQGKSYDDGFPQDLVQPVFLKNMPSARINDLKISGVDGLLWVEGIYPYSRIGFNLGEKSKKADATTIGVMLDNMETAKVADSILPLHQYAGDKDHLFWGLVSLPNENFQQPCLRMHVKDLYFFITRSSDETLNFVPLKESVGEKSLYGTYQRIENIVNMINGKQ